MARLQLRQLAEARGIEHWQELYKRVNKQSDEVSPALVRRYWHETATGAKQDCGTLRVINLRALNALADAIGVEPSDLIAR